MPYKEPPQLPPNLSNPTCGDRKRIVGERMDDQEMLDELDWHKDAWV
jgi:hypothetical protein